MTHQPFNDDPDHIPVKKWHPIMILWFLNFHRKFIIGTLLAAAVGYLLLRLNHQAPFDESNATVAQAGDSIPLPAVRDPEPQPTEIAAPTTTPTDALTVDQQINLLLGSSNQWRGLTAEDAAIALELRLTLVKDLIDGRELKPNQSNYCIQEYIKTIGLLSEHTPKISRNIEGFDKTVTEAEQAYGTIENNEIAALAKAVFVSHLARKFTATQSEENFEAFKAAFSKRRDAILKSNIGMQFVTNALRDTTAKAGDNPRLRKIATEHLMSVIFVKDTAVVDLAGNLFFPEVDWVTLPGRLNNQSPGADADIEILLESLKTQPNTPQAIYLTIFFAIKSYQVNGQADKARQALEQIEAIGQQITLGPLQDEVLQRIKTLKDSSTN